MLTSYQLFNSEDELKSLEELLEELDNQDFSKLINKLLEIEIVWPEEELKLDWQI